jgi:hypothetical protein
VEAGGENRELEAKLGLPRGPRSQLPFQCSARRQAWGVGFCAVTYFSYGLARSLTFGFGRLNAIRAIN